MRSIHGRVIIIISGLLALAILTGGSPASAALNAGVRAGFSADPDQFVVGGQATLGTIMPEITLVPSLDFGFGDNVGVTTLNLDLHYNLPSLPKVSPNFYVGGGPAVVMIDPDGGNSDTKIGLSVLAGLRIPMTGVTYYNLETRFGLENAPDLKVLLGIMFGL